jgi:hypothetical protein
MLGGHIIKESFKRNERGMYLLGKVFIVACDFEGFAD